MPAGPELLQVHVLVARPALAGPDDRGLPSAGTACRWAQENRQRYVAGAREELRELFPIAGSSVPARSIEKVSTGELLDRSPELEL